MNIEQQKPHDPLSGEHQANDTGPIDWKAFHRGGKTLTMKAKRKDYERQPITNSATKKV